MLADMCTTVVGPGGNIYLLSEQFQSKLHLSDKEDLAHLETLQLEVTDVHDSFPNLASLPTLTNNQVWKYDCAHAYA